MDEKKIKFLEKILKLAEQDPRLIGEGRQIFQDNMPPAFEEGCAVGIHLDERGKAYFRYFGGQIPLKKQDGVNVDAKALLDRGRRYFPTDYDAFAKEFHLYDGDRKLKDLFDSIR